jgi:hypothetical protein
MNMRGKLRVDAVNHGQKNGKATAKSEAAMRRQLAVVGAGPSGEAIRCG